LTGTYNYDKLINQLNLNNNQIFTAMEEKNYYRDVFRIHKMMLETIDELRTISPNSKKLADIIKQFNDKIRNEQEQLLARIEMDIRISCSYNFANDLEKLVDSRLGLSHKQTYMKGLVKTIFQTLIKSPWAYTFISPLQSDEQTESFLKKYQKDFGLISKIFNVGFKTSPRPCPYGTILETYIS